MMTLSIMRGWYGHLSSPDKPGRLCIFSSTSSSNAFLSLIHIKTIIPFPHQALQPSLFLLPASHTSLPCGLQDKCGIAYIQATARSFPLLSVSVDTPTP